MVVPLLMEGLTKNWRCLYLGSPDAVHMVDSALTVRATSSTGATFFFTLPGASLT